MKASLSFGVDSGTGNFYKNITGTAEQLSAGQRREVEVAASPTTMEVKDFREFAAQQIAEASATPGIGNADAGMKRVDGVVSVTNTGNISLRIRQYIETDAFMNPDADDYKDLTLEVGSTFSTGAIHSNKQTYILLGV